MPSLARL